MNKKQIAALVLSAAMAASGLGISAQAKTLSEQVKTPKTVLVGDCNQDGTVDLSDLVSMQLYLLRQKTAGEMPEEQSAWDLNLDAQVNIVDLCLLKQILLQQKQVTQQYRTDILSTSSAGVVPPEVEIHSVEELTAYLTPYTTESERETFCERYDADFFAESVLLLKPMGKTMKAYACQVTGADAKTLQVSYGCIWEKEKPTGIQQFAWMQVAIPKMQDHEQVVWQSVTPEVTLNWCAVTGNDAFSDGSETRIDSTEELQTYLETILQPYEIPEYLQQYDDAFFAESTLVVHSFQLRNAAPLEYTAIQKNQALAILLSYQQAGGKQLTNYLAFAAVRRAELSEISNVGFLAFGGTSEDEADWLYYDAPDQKHSLVVLQNSDLFSGTVSVYRCDADGNAVYSNGVSYWITWKDTEAVVTYHTISDDNNTCDTVVVPY
ncbi:MAG: dockerin type I repeat-containing protein [Ruminococcus sp.]|nr:dockerin type I repeat-containing protein [Ruminococcus sp.]